MGKIQIGNEKGIITGSCKGMSMGKNAMYTESSYALSYSPENIKNYYLQNLTGK